MFHAPDSLLENQLFELELRTMFWRTRLFDEGQPHSGVSKRIGANWVRLMSLKPT